MQYKYQRPMEEILFNYAKAGLIHKYRECHLCASRMVITRRENDIANYMWDCTLCHYKLKITKNTPMNGINIRALD